MKKRFVREFILVSRQTRELTLMLTNSSDKVHTEFFAQSVFPIYSVMEIVDEYERYRKGLVSLRESESGKALAAQG